MQQYVARRLLLFIPTLLLLTLLVFLFLRIIPGDPALLILAGTTGGGSFSPEALEELRLELGTDRALHIQYGTWIWDLLRGELGNSYYFGTSIWGELKFRIPVTLELSFLGMLISFVIAVPLGILSAIAQKTPLDYIARIFSFTGLAVPTFVTGIVTVYLLVRIFNWFPPLDYTPPWEDLGRNLTQMIFPSLAMALFGLAFIARITRSSMLEVLRQDYVRTARSKGLRERRVIFLHALQNAFLPVLTVTGWLFGVFLGGAVIIEKIFLLPGMGRLLVESIFHRDYPVIQAEVLLIAGMVLLLNLVIDLVYASVDPRIRYG